MAQLYKRGSYSQCSLYELENSKKHRTSLASNEEKLLKLKKGSHANFEAKLKKAQLDIISHLKEKSGVQDVPSQQGNLMQCLTLISRNVKLVDIEKNLLEVFSRFVKDFSPAQAAVFLKMFSELRQTPVCNVSFEEYVPEVLYPFWQREMQKRHANC